MGQIIKNSKFKFMTLRFAALLILPISTSFAAYEMKSYTINNGGDQLSSDRFEIQSSIGQVDAQTTTNSDNYELKSGFWKENTDLIFKSNFK